MTNFAPKTLAASTALAALTLGMLALQPAQAASVSIYGIIDTGFNYTHTDADQKGVDAEDSFSEKSSQMIPTRFGLRGSEDLGNGWGVSFLLENMSSSDDGSMIGGRLFHRAAEVTISGPYGKLTMGRSGLLRSGFGTTGIWAGKLNPFSNSWGSYIAGSKFVMPGDFRSADNTVTYATPTFAGLQLHAQYSMKVDSVTANVKDLEENSPETDRVWSLGATYTQGNLHVTAVLDSILYGNKIPSNTLGKDLDDSLAFSLGGAYDFGAAKLYASGMVFEGMTGAKFQGHDFEAVSSINKGASYKGYSLQLGVDVPVGAGTIKANIGRMDAKADQVFTTGADIADTDRIALGLGYTHALSKRTTLYTGAGWLKDTSNVVEGAKPTATELVAGMVHRF